MFLSFINKILSSLLFPTFIFGSTKFKLQIYKQDFRYRLCLHSHYLEITGLVVCIFFKHSINWALNSWISFFVVNSIALLLVGAIIYDLEKKMRLYIYIYIYNYESDIYIELTSVAIFQPKFCECNLLKRNICILFRPILI